MESTPTSEAQALTGFTILATPSHLKLLRFALDAMIAIRSSPHASRDDIKAALDLEAEFESRLAATTTEP